MARGEVAGGGGVELKTTEIDKRWPLVWLISL